jgi:hypothetical protein
LTAEKPLSKRVSYLDADLFDKREGIFRDVSLIESGN